MSTMKSRRVLQGAVATVGAAAAIAALMPAANADIIQSEVISSLSQGTQFVAPGQAVTVDYWVKEAGQPKGCDASVSSPLTVLVTAPADVTVSPSSLKFTACSVSQSVTMTPVGAGTFDIPEVTAIDDAGSYQTNGTKFKIVAATADTPTDVTPPPAPVNHAPVVLTAASDVNIDEGSTVTASGAFSDSDAGDVLTLSASSTVGTFVDNGNGSWTYSLPTRDNTAGTVTVTATDKAGATATDDFAYLVNNVAPAVGMQVKANDSFGCSVSATVDWQDPGLDDRHTGSFAWSDGVTGALSGNPTTVTRAFTQAGRYDVSSTVTDDDHGAGSATGSHTVYNLPSALLQPVNDARNGQPLSSFKLGSTIPVKITVKDCAGSSVAALAPQVSVATGTFNEASVETEATSTATPTSGTTMRYDATGQQYVYNLSTKALSAGDWTIVIRDGSFKAPVTAWVNIRK